MKSKHNLRVPIIVGWLVTGTVIVIGVISGSDVLSNFGAILCGIVTMLASIVLVFGHHTELLAGASEPVELGKYGKILVILLGIILFSGGFIAAVMPFISYL